MTKIRCTDTFHGGVEYFNRQRQAKLNVLTEFTGNVVSQRLFYRDSEIFISARITISTGS